MSHRQAYLASTSDGLLGGAFVVVGFVVLVVVTAVDLITSRWSPSAPVNEDSGPKQASVAPLHPSTEDPKPLSDIETLPITQPPLTDADPAAGRSVEDQHSSPPTRDLDHQSPPIEQSKTDLPLEEDVRLTESIPVIHDHEEVTVANDSSQEWVSLSKPDDTLLPTTEGDLQPEEPTTSLVPEHETPQAEASSSGQEIEFSSSTLIDAPNTAMTITSDTSSLPPSTPEPDTHSFDAVRIQTDTEKQAPLNPEFNGSVGELKGRASTPSLRSASGSIIRGGAPEYSIKKKRPGNSFIRKSSTLVNKVFKNKDGSSDSSTLLSDNNPPLASSVVSEPESLEQSVSGLEVSTSTDPPGKKLTSPSRSSLVSIRSIGGSIKKKIIKSSASDKDVAVGAQGQVPDPEAQSSTNKAADATGSGPSLLKTMFKVRKPSK